MENNWYVDWLRENNLTRPEVYRQFGVPIRTQENCHTITIVNQIMCSIC